MQILCNLSWYAAWRHLLTSRLWGMSVSFSEQAYFCFQQPLVGACWGWKALTWADVQPQIGGTLSLSTLYAYTITRYCITLCDNIQKLPWQTLPFSTRPHEQLDHGGMLLKWLVFIKSFTSEKMGDSWSDSTFFCSYHTGTRKTAGGDKSYAFILASMQWGSLSEACFRKETLFNGHQRITPVAAKRLVVLQKAAEKQQPDTMSINGFWLNTWVHSLISGHIE